MFAAFRIILNIVARRSVWPIPPTHLLSILRMSLLFIPTVVLLVGTDASKMYHSVRGQDTIKLYVIFNALEVSPSESHPLPQSTMAPGYHDCRLS